MGNPKGVYPPWLKRPHKGVYPRWLERPPKGVQPPHLAAARKPPKGVYPPQFASIRPPKGVTPPQLVGKGNVYTERPPVSVPEIAAEPVKLPFKIVGGWLRSAQFARACGCGACGKWIRKGEAYASVGHDLTARGGKNTQRALRVECWKQRLEDRDPRKMIVVHDLARRTRSGTNRGGKSWAKRPKQTVVLFLNEPRSAMLSEIMEWAGHDRGQAILYAMLDAGYKRWRERRDSGTLPPKPPPLPPKHYGPHLVKVGGME